MKTSKLDMSDNITPICPFCEKEIKEIVNKQFDKSVWAITQKYLYLCPNCKKVIGIGQSAWMP